MTRHKRVGVIVMVLAMTAAIIVFAGSYLPCIAQCDSSIMVTLQYGGFFEDDLTHDFLLKTSWLLTVCLVAFAVGLLFWLEALDPPGTSHGRETVTKS